MKDKNNKTRKIAHKPIQNQSKGAEDQEKPRPPRKPLFSKELFKKLLPLIKAFVLWFILIAILHIPGIKQDFRDLIVGFTTSSSVFIGKLFFLPVERLATSTFSVAGFSMEIIVECTAYNFYLFALTLSIFANWKPRHKLINLLIFILVIFFVNNLRFYAMGYIGHNYPELFDSTHDYVWNILFGFMIFGIWAWRDQKNNPDFQPKKVQP